MHPTVHRVYSLMSLPVAFVRLVLLDIGIRKPNPTDGCMPVVHRNVEVSMHGIMVPAEGRQGEVCCAIAE
jgi:hypothetical protein